MCLPPACLSPAKSQLLPAPASSPRDPPRRAARSAPGPYEVAAQVRDLCGHPPRAKSASPALWSSCIQAPLPFRAKGSGGASSGRWSAGWSPAWDSVHSLLGESCCSLTHSRVWVPRPADAGIGCTSSAPSCRLVMVSLLPSCHGFLSMPLDVGFLCW